MFALMRRDAQASNAVVTSILSVFSYDAHVLFDPGSTHSYLSLIFAKCFTKELDRLKEPFLLATSVGETLLVNSGFRDYCVSACGRDTKVDLMLFHMSEFDVILGMN